jgi:hypothetical protein
METKISQDGPRWAGGARSAGRPRRVRGAAACAAVVLAAGAALAGCGGGKNDAGGGAGHSGVASLTSPSAGGGKGSGTGGSTGGATPSAGTFAGAVDAKRPQLRLDTPENEVSELLHVYSTCLLDHGVPQDTGPGVAGDGPEPTGGPVAHQKYKAAFDACLVKLPKQPPQTDPNTNAHYADDYRAFVQCLQKGGMKVHEVPDTSVNPNGFGWTFDDNSSDSLTPQQEDELNTTCMVEAFGGSK